MQCFSCKTEIEVTDRVGRGEICPSCGNDVHVCKNCLHYDVKAYNECRENQADRVLEKNRSNFCDFFVPSEEMRGQVVQDPLAEAKKKLESLFKK